VKRIAKQPSVNRVSVVEPPLVGSPESVEADASASWVGVGVGVSVGGMGVTVGVGRFAISVDAGQGQLKLSRRLSSVPAISIRAEI
jgi:hypothetical protein